MEFLPIKINEKKVYAGFFKRLGAAIVDMVVVLLMFFVFQFIGSSSISAAIVILIFSSTSYFFYNVYFHYKFGATLGKMALGIRVTSPDGSRIGFKQALLRSSVDMIFSLVAVTVQVIAILKVDADLYLAAGMIERSFLTLPLIPSWYGLLDTLSQCWYWSEIVVLLFNKRRRGLHDFIAGTVVIRKEYAGRETQQGAINSTDEDWGFRD